MNSESLEKELDFEAIKQFIKITHAWGVSEDARKRIFRGDCYAALIRAIVDPAPVLTEQQHRATSLVVATESLLNNRSVPPFDRLRWIDGPESKKRFKGRTALDILFRQDAVGLDLMESEVYRLM